MQRTEIRKPDITELQKEECPVKKGRMCALLMAVVMLFGLSACRSERENSPEEKGTDSSETESGAGAEETKSAGEKTAVRLMGLSGASGIGAVGMFRSGRESSANEYSWSSSDREEELAEKLISGTADIALMSSDQALRLYHETDGGIRILAYGTEGILSVLESGDTEVSSLADLWGRTVYCAGEGEVPEYVLRYLLRGNGIDPDEEVNLIFEEESEIIRKLGTGEADLALLPADAAAEAVIQGEGSVRTAFSLTEEWDAVNVGSRLLMTAAVAGTEFAEENPETVQNFLEDYRESIEYVTQHPEEAAELAADLGMTESAEAAEKAISLCSLAFLSGQDMEPAVNGYYFVLWEADPDCIGESLPDDGIYYIP